MKMETPKMDVVRFKEADVIVASGEVVDNRQFAKLSGWEVAPVNSATVGFKTGANGTYTEHSYDELHTTPEMYGLTFDNGRNTITLSELAQTDEKYGEFNGTYILSGNSIYTWYNGQ